MPKRVLLVEDEPQLLGLMAVTLQQRGYAIRAASTVADALRWQQEPFDLIILDHRLPNGIGETVEAAFPTVPALHISGYDGAGWRVDLVKPFTPSDLVAAVAQRIPA